MSNAAAALPAVQEQKNGVAPLHAPRTDLVTLSVGQAMQIAKSLYASGYFEKVKNPEQAFAKILAGQELGIGPMQALASIHIVEGKPTLDATLVRARIKSSGKYDVRTLVSDDNKCSLQFLENGRVLGVCTFTIEDAKRAALIDKLNWKRYPKSMLLARATMAGAREFTPDVFGGPIYSSEELEAVPAPQADTQPKDVTPQDELREKLIQGKAAIESLVQENAIPEEVVAAEWANLIGGAATTYPTWRDGELAMLRDFYKSLRALISPPQSTVSTTAAPEAVEGETLPPQDDAQVKTEASELSAEDQLAKEVDDFAEPRPQTPPPIAQERAIKIDPKIIEEFHGYVSPVDIDALCVVAAEAGLSGVNLRDLVKQGTKGHPFTKSSYEEVLRVVEALKAQKTQA